MINPNAYAVLVGVNEFTDSKLPDLKYAAKDAADVFQTLTHHSSSIFKSQNVIKLDNYDITKRRLETSLHSHLVKGRTRDDFVLFYYAGHGFLSNDKYESYLATYDTSIENIKSNPNDGLRMSFLYQDIFRATNASVLFIFDCCFSGSFGQDSKGDIKGLIARTFEPQVNKVCLLSCASNRASEEHDQLRNGVFTHFLLEGLKGAAAPSDSATVTPASLFSYLTWVMEGTEQQPCFYGYESTGTVLSRPKEYHQAPHPKTSKSIFRDNIIPQLLLSPLDKYDGFIADLISFYNQQQPEHQSGIGPFMMQVIRRAFDADLVYYAEDVLKHNKIIYESRSSEFSSTISTSSIHSAIRSIIFHRLDSIIPEGFKVNLLNTAINTIYPENTIVVRVGPRSPSSVLVIHARTDKYCVAEDVIGAIISAIYHASNKFSSLARANALKCTIYDSLKSAYKYVSSGMYEERFQAFCEDLSRVEMHFEPIFCLNQPLYIDAWEALARFSDTKKTPIELFDAAEMWGVRFQTELDLYCVRKAFETYIPQMREIDKNYVLSVNVYPSTIIQTAFHRQLEDLKNDQLLMKRKAILEITERTLIPAKNPYDDFGTSLEDFREVMKYLANSFGLNFAIDDFGVGYASISRLVNLRPSWVKIDRGVLHYEHGLGKNVIRFVVDLKHRLLAGGIKVVVEGLDRYSNISVQELKDELSVDYVQGYALGMAIREIDQPALVRLCESANEYERSIIK